MRLDETARIRLTIDVIGTALCIAAAAAFYFFGLSPLLSARQDAEHHEAKVAAKRATAAELSGDLARQHGVLRDAERELAESPLQLAAASDVNARIARVADLARSCGLKLDVIVPGMPQRGKRFETVPIHLTGTGNYRTCVTMLHRLRQTFPDTTVTSLDLSADPADRQAVAQFTIGLLWHAAPELFAETDSS